jgi:hypothetical protein
VTIKLLARSTSRQDGRARASDLAPEVSYPSGRVVSRSAPGRVLCYGPQYNNKTHNHHEYHHSFITIDGNFLDLSIIAP